MDNLKVINRKDEKILVELIKNSRIPINQLAKKVGVSREVATYRINQLVKQEIIKEFYTEINESLLGFERFGCLFQLKSITEKEEKNFISQIVKNKRTTYFGPIIGKWNFAFDILVKSKEELEQVLSEISKGYVEKIKEYVVNFIPTEKAFFPLKIFGPVQKSEIKKSKKAQLTKKDFEILKLLRNNSRIEYSELSRKLNLTANGIKHRIKNLEEFGIIDHYTISLNYSKLNFEFYNLQIRFLDHDFSKLKDFITKDKRIKYFYKHIGNPKWDLDIGILVKNSGELRELLMEIKNLFGNHTEINDIYLVPEVTKENIAPDVLFEN